MSSSPGLQTVFLEDQGSLEGGKEGSHQEAGGQEGGQRGRETGGQQGQGGHQPVGQQRGPGLCAKLAKISSPEPIIGSYRLVSSHNYEQFLRYLNAIQRLGVAGGISRNTVIIKCTVPEDIE